MAKNNNLEQDGMANVEEALTASERFIENNQNTPFSLGQYIN